MLKKILLGLFAFMLSMSAAFASINVNTATQAELETIKGIGPAMSKKIIDERASKGTFKDGKDLAARVSGIGAKRLESFTKQGLTVGTEPAAATATANTPAELPKPTAKK
jgi:competence protein ComEA